MTAGYAATSQTRQPANLNADGRHECFDMNTSNDICPPNEQAVETSDAENVQLSNTPDLQSNEPPNFHDVTTDLSLSALVKRIEFVVASEIERLLRAFNDKLAYDETKQLQIERLHKELKDHQSDLLARTALPIARGVIRVHDHIGKLHTTLESRDQIEFTLNSCLTLLQSLQEDLELVLEDNGVDKYREHDTSFNPKRQKIARKTETTHNQLHGTVETSIAPGFEFNGRIVEKERVSIYVLQQPTSISTSTNE